MERPKAGRVPRLGCGPDARQSRGFRRRGPPDHGDRSARSPTGQGTHRCSVVPLGLCAGAGAGAGPSGCDVFGVFTGAVTGALLLPARPRTSTAVHRRIRGLRSGYLLPCSPAPPAGGRPTLTVPHTRALSGGPARIRNYDRAGSPRGRPPSTNLTIALAAKRLRRRR
jgi:hypothetical protein